MVGKAAALSQDQAELDEGAPNGAGPGPATWAHASLKHWPLALIGAGLVLSMAWCAGLLYGAFILASWAMS